MIQLEYEQLIEQAVKNPQSSDISKLSLRFQKVLVLLLQIVMLLVVACVGHIG